MLSAKKLAASAAVLSFVLVGPALAQNSRAPTLGPGNASAATAANNGGSALGTNNRGAAEAGNTAGINQSGPQQVVNSAAKVVAGFKSNPDFNKLLEQSKGVFIIPNLVKGAVVVGGSEGTGVLVAHDNGHWSDPAFLTLGSISIGAQAGAKAGPVVMFLMTPKAVGDFTQHNNFSINGNAGLTIVTWSPKAQGSVGKGDVIVWSGQNGAFAGLDINGADIHADTGYDKAYYQNRYTETKQIIESSASNANASTLLTELPG